MRLSKFVILTMVVVLLQLTPALAKVNMLDEVVVTATRIEQDPAEVGSSITVISREEIEQQNKSTVAEVLRSVAGINVAQSGARGGLSQVYLRGGSPGQAMVLIDGVEVRYPMEMDGGFYDWGALSTDNVERIEIIRGPHSTLYGSSALAGVINVITRKGEGTPRVTLEVEGGANNTIRRGLSVNGASDVCNYAVAFSHLSAKGPSSAAGGTEDDGCEVQNVSARLGWYVLDDSELSVSVRRTDEETDLDDGAYEDDPNYIAHKQMMSAHIAFDQPLLPWWEHKISYSFLDANRNYQDIVDEVDTTDDIESWYKGDVRKFDWQHTLYPSDAVAVVIGYDNKREIGEAYYRNRAWVSAVPKQAIDNQGAYAEIQGNYDEMLFVTVGGRTDDHDMFGRENTYRTSVACIIPVTGTHIKGSYGTGFRAPSMFQLYSAYGDTTLQPEEVRSFDYGIEQDFWNERITAGATCFFNNFKNLIEYDLATNKYANIGRATTKGVEFTLAFTPLDDLTLTANYTLMEAEDRTNSRELQRRPKREGNLLVNYVFLDKANLNATVHFAGSRWSDANNQQRLTRYTTVDMALTVDVTEHITLQVRGENVADREYADVYGFNSPGASYYAGLKFVF